MSNFEKAARIKLRFVTTLGLLSVEDLWDLPIESNGNRPSLKSIATELNKEINAQPQTALDFFESSTTVDPVLQLKFDIVKHMVVTRLAENKAKSEEKAKESQRAHIQELINAKKADALKEKSIEELEAMLG